MLQVDELQVGELRQGRTHQLLGDACVATLQAWGPGRERTSEFSIWRGGLGEKEGMGEMENRVQGNVWEPD